MPPKRKRDDKDDDEDDDDETCPPAAAETAAPANQVDNDKTVVVNRDFNGAGPWIREEATVYVQAAMLAAGMYVATSVTGVRFYLETSEQASDVCDVLSAVCIRLGEEVAIGMTGAALRWLVSALVRRGLNLNAVSFYNRWSVHGKTTVLMMALRSSPRLVHVLLDLPSEYGLDVNARDDGNDSPLRLAIGMSMAILFVMKAPWTR